ncbi:MAG TPA: hypothetical protein VH595_04000, partial [Verrucomicrobiae bacterium]|nr:hypothetical protein [Verrucomicrobiae bacterium]
ELAMHEQTDASAVVDDVLKLSQAGLQVDPAQVTEKTGYKVTIRPTAENSPKPTSYIHPPAQSQLPRSIGRYGAKSRKSNPASAAMPSLKRPLAVIQNRRK